MKNQKLSFPSKSILVATLVAGFLTSGLGGVHTAQASPASTSIQNSLVAVAKNTTINDVDKSWTYSGNWEIAKTKRTFGGQLHLSNSVGDTASIIISGSPFTLIYSTNKNSGTLDIFVDDSLIKTINQNSAKPNHQQEWKSPELTTGKHTIKFVHNSGSEASIDAIKVRLAASDSNPVPPTNPVVPASPTSEITNPTQNPAPNELPTLTQVPSPTNTATIPTDFPSPTPTQIPTQIPSSTVTTTSTPVPTSTSAPTQLPTFTQVSTSTAILIPTQPPTFTKVPTSTASLIPTQPPTFTQIPTSTATTIPTQQPTFTSPIITLTSTAIPTMTQTTTSTSAPTPSPTQLIPNSQFYYVDGTGGSDTNPGSNALPWRTIQKAVNSAPAKSEIRVLAGSYNERVSISTSKVDLVLVCQNSRQCITKGFDVFGTRISISDFKIQNATLVGIDVRGKDNNIINNEVTHTIYNGTDADGMRGWGSGHEFINNYIHDVCNYSEGRCGTAHVDTFQTWGDASRGGALVNSVFDGNTFVCTEAQTKDEECEGIILEGGSHDIIIRNNLFILFKGINSTGSSNILVEKNTFVGNPTYKINLEPIGSWLSGGSGNISRDNIYQGWMNSAVGGGSVTTSHNLFWNSTVLSTYYHSANGDVKTDPQLDNNYCSHNPDALAFGASCGVAANQ